MTAQETTNANFFSTTLTNAIGASDLSITLDSIGTLTSPAYLVIDPNSDSKREVILADGTWSGNTVTLTGTGNRGLAGSASGAQAHDPNTLVVSVPLAQHLEDINDRVDAITVVTDHDGLTGLADDDHTQYLNTTRHGTTAHDTELVVACSDEVTAISTTGTKVTFRLPYAMTLTGVRASLTSACATGTFTVDINEAGVSVLSTKLTIDATEETSTTAAVAAVISDSALADDAEITIDVDNVGDSTATGLKVTLIGTRT